MALSPYGHCAVCAACTGRMHVYTCVPECVCFSSEGQVSGDDKAGLRTPGIHVHACTLLCCSCGLGRA
eukprot:2887397-Lingulodinium_polyedra.AAC.1